ncbi:helix-turn-helix transcriptional regulator [Phaeovulum vinaykumarii]|uniref:Predicted DNA-binding transcriptional regulator YafY, contains an HTH and WYL domains n=1 Tax=Phaeovulum vinaykumarii TaxID=407234 RepID=A0A1N7LLB4_9RHOB|nr:WYL domain-containing protein [Phaeovulum vinaykumarii]SIS74521.1 Predicted DNA-binding transcriptional regulator YafY, contains an HTH and WYL domains [Phaeovulum vinaykumarii]SOC05075.1 predicted DNA-binding transcriptional regulator YafY [Phaeovulum vinaykumarii]
MSFAKATDLLRLAEMASATYEGVSLSDIETSFGVDRRTAQRMTRALETAFPHCRTRTDDSRRKYWKIDARDARLMLAQGVRDSELSALEIAIRRAAREGAAVEQRALEALRDRLLAAMPGAMARRVEADAEAVLEAHGFASRPGPRLRPRPDLLRVIAQALKGPHQLSIGYQGAQDDAPRPRLIEPHGLLLGTRRYLIAREVGGSGRMQSFRLDRIVEAQLRASSFQRDPDFDLSAHAARAFGSYFDEAEFGPVVWRFAPEAAAVAREFIFHPAQEMTDQADGSLVVRFCAAGHLEMAWHLYQWGDAVEVLAPPALRALTQAHRRADFPALP